MHPFSFNTITDYLRNPKGIFCTSIDSFHGAQARNSIVVLDSPVEAYKCRNFILRTIALEIVIVGDISFDLKPTSAFEEDNQFMPECVFYYKNKIIDYTIFIGLNYKFLHSIQNGIWNIRTDVNFQFI